MSSIGKELVGDAAHIPIVDVVDGNNLVTNTALLQVGLNFFLFLLILILTILEIYMVLEATKLSEKHVMATLLLNVNLVCLILNSFIYELIESGYALILTGQTNKFKKIS